MTPLTLRHVGFGNARASGNDAVMQPHSIKIVQTSLETGRERVADLCWSSLVMISDRTRGRKSPSEVLDAMLWCDKVLTIRFAYRTDHWVTM